ncbi:NDP-sugar synthase [Ureibacillus chungkukjangi]|uniref:nucleotidyltransferase family protein n=1 Tax=Ureibacillus chungkukjangi TaxID=1202712 RepID=UPI0020413B9E|nr:NDP-sugar synthase [Ureibacillus chungkukjangi]MCM3389799.1 NDP-sugar synthase [Ureibacillus chungkukjangi]
MTEYIIVQAGGKGTRLEYLTRNKPKCLVPINNLPMLFHLFKKFPNSKFIIIGDYHFDVLDEYLKAFAGVQYLLVRSTGKQGTLSGIKDALEFLPKAKPFLLVWSDLILAEDLNIPNKGRYIGISKDFRCRWSYKDGIFEEEPSFEHGVAGLFQFENKELLKGVPEEGEFVRWLQSRNLEFDELPMYKSKEYGLLSEYEKLEPQKCRPFNQLIVKDKTIIKKAITKQGNEIADKELAWYRYVQEKSDFNHIPTIHSYEPFEMEKVIGQNIYECKEYDEQQKKTILADIIQGLKELHNIEKSETDYFSVKEAYFTKTIDRLSKVRDLIPYANQETITINNRKCRNIFFYKNQLEEKVQEFQVLQFEFLHGDCTFSNIMVNDSLKPIFIDPRGYFGYTQLFGDPDYDWAKLYYSVVGNYDQFNLKRFNLNILDGQVNIEVESNGWEHLETDFFDLIPNTVSKEKIKLLHAIIWLSLTTYAWEDFDSICGAFYLGLYYLEEVL